MFESEEKRSLSVFKNENYIMLKYFPSFNKTKISERF